MTGDVKEIARDQLAVAGIRAEQCLTDTFKEIGAEVAAAKSGRSCSSVLSFTSAVLIFFVSVGLEGQTNTSCQFQVIAGPPATFGGDGGPATQAWLFDPKGLTSDQKGNLYIADTRNNRVRKVGVDGVINTVAGNGTSGYSGDGGPALKAALSNPAGLVVAPDGTLFVSDTGNHVIRTLATDGTIRTFAGTGHPGFSGDGQPALAAELNTPAGLALDSNGQLYIADSANNRIRKVDGNGLITTVAGTGNCCYGGDGGPAISANIHGPRGVGVDGQGNLLIADTLNSLIRGVDTRGIISTVAGGADTTGNTYPASPTKISLSSLEDLAILADGSVLLPGPGGILILSADRGSISIFAAGNQFGAVVSSDSQGGAYANGYGIDVIWRTPKAGSAAERAAGQPWYGRGTEGGPAIGATLHTPMGVAVGNDGSLYVGDHDNGRVLKISPTGTIHALAEIAGPEFVSVDASGNVFVSDDASQAIKKITPLGAASIFAGGVPGEVPNPGEAPLPATSVGVYLPFGLVAHPDGNLYAFVHDPNQFTSAIVKITPSGMLSTLFFPQTHGLLSPIDAYHGLSVDAQGNLLFGSSVFSNGSAIYRMDTRGNLLSSLGTIPALSGYLLGLAGGASGAVFSLDALGRIKQMSSGGLFASVLNRDLDEFFGYVDYSLPYSYREFNIDIATDSGGNLYVSEANLHRVLKLPAGSCPVQTGPVIGGVVNSANFDASRSPTGFAPGELISIFGYFMGPQTGVGATLDASGLFAFELGGVRVLFEGIPGVVLYAGASQVNAIVPFTMYGRDTVRMQVENNGIESDAFTLTMADSSPSVFSLQASGDVRDVTVFNQDGSLNSQTNPAKPGSVVVVYATGLGRTDPKGQDGHLATAPYPKPLLPLTADSGPVAYAGDAPGLVEGVSQINFLAPSSQGSVSFQQGNVTFKVFVWVQ